MGFSILEPNHCRDLSLRKVFQNGIGINLYLLSGKLLGSISFQRLIYLLIVTSSLSSVPQPRKRLHLVLRSGHQIDPALVFVRALPRI